MRAIDKDNGEAYRPMGTDGWIGTSGETVNLIQSLGSLVNGLTIRVTGAGSSRRINHRCAGNTEVVASDMYYWGSSNSQFRIFLLSQGDLRSAMRLRNARFRPGHVNQTISVGGFVELLGGAILSADAELPVLFSALSTTDMPGMVLSLVGFDASGASSSATLAGAGGSTPFATVWTQCTLPASYVLLASDAQGAAGTTVELRQCRTASVDGIWAYADSLGSAVLDTGITYDGEAASWRITTTADASAACPFVTPWVAWSDPPTTSCTPRIEILRDGSTTPFTDAQIAAEFVIPVSAGIEIKTDIVAVGASAADQAAGSGLGDWAGEGGSAWSGAIDAGAAVTPVAGRDLMGRIVVAAPSITLYASPTIRA